MKITLINQKPRPTDKILHVDVHRADPRHVLERWFNYRRDPPTVVIHVDRAA